MVRRQRDGAAPSYLVRSGWYVAVVLAGMTAFAGTGPTYHATIELVRGFATDQYGAVVASIGAILWWPLVAVLLFLLSLVFMVTLFKTTVFVVAKWLQ